MEMCMMMLKGSTQIISANTVLGTEGWGGLDVAPPRHPSTMRANTERGFARACLTLHLASPRQAKPAASLPCCPQEMVQLRRQNRRNVVHIQHLEALQAKQNAVLQRKICDATAARKKLKELQCGNSNNIGGCLGFYTRVS